MITNCVRTIALKMLLAIVLISYPYWVDQCEKRRVKMVVVGIPKTIDNDIELLDKTFGFDTAVEEAQRAINAAYTEVCCFSWVQVY